MIQYRDGNLDIAMQPIIATPFDVPDMLMIFLVVLLLFASRKFRELGQGMRDAMNEFTRERDQLFKQQHEQSSQDDDEQPAKRVLSPKAARLARTFSLQPIVLGVV